MAPAMKSMKAVLQSPVRAAVNAHLGLAGAELKKFAGCLKLKLQKKPARPARKGANPFAEEPCVFKAKPASKTVHFLPMKKFKEMVN